MDTSVMRAGENFNLVRVDVNCFSGVNLFGSGCNQMIPGLYGGISAFLSIRQSLGAVANSMNSNTKQQNLVVIIY